MFTINTNWAIKMNRGDEVQFPLFVNNGDRRNWVRYEFNREYNPEEECEEIYFYIIPLHLDYDNFVLKKTFSCNGTITTEKPNEDTIISTNNNTLNENHDFVITLDENDTKSLCDNEYVYLVRAKVLTEKINSKNIITTGKNKFTTIQITNKYPFYLIDDEIIRAD